MSTFVSVGNATQTFPRLLDEVARIASFLPTPVVVQHGVTPFVCAGCRAVPFVQMEEFEHLIVSSELLILHAGAGSVIHAIRAGKRPVVMPRQAKIGEHVDNHQIEFAKTLEALGKVIVAEEAAQLMSAIELARTRPQTNTTTPVVPRIIELLDETLEKYVRQYK